MKRKSLMSVLVCLFILGTCVGAVREISVSNTVNGRELPIYSVETEAKRVALSFDATWGNEYMKQILDVLDKYDVKATFFLTGNWVGKYPEDVKQIASRQFQIVVIYFKHILFPPFIGLFLRQMKLPPDRSYISCPPLYPIRFVNPLQVILLSLYLL